MKKLILFFTLALSTTLYASIDKQDISLVEVDANHKNLKQIVSQFEVIKATDSKVQLYVPRFRISELYKLAPKSKLLRESIYTEEELVTTARGYKSYDEIVAIMQDLATRYPELISLNSYGESVKGNKLYSLKVSDNVKLDEEEPEILITAATHGDELITAEGLIRFIVNMIKLKDTDERIRKMLQEHELFFIPVVNPDGFKKRRRYTADGTDPNREYPYPEKPNKESVQCIKKEIEFFKKRNFVASMDLHAHGRMIMYPWGFTKDEVLSSDKKMFETLGQKMAKDNGYKVGQISRIIYVAPASSADFWYWNNNTIAFGIELGRSKVPSARKIDKIVGEMTSMIYTFIENF
jgi:hypothetical protein